MLKFEEYKTSLFGHGKVLRSQQRFKSENHAVYTECINKVALSCDDDKGIMIARMELQIIFTGTF